MLYKLLSQPNQPKAIRSLQEAYDELQAQEILDTGGSIRKETSQEIYVRLLRSNSPGFCIAFIRNNSALRRALEKIESATKTSPNELEGLTSLLRAGDKLDPSFFDANHELTPEGWQNKLIHGYLTNRLSKDEYQTLSFLYDMWVETHETRAYRAAGYSDHPGSFTSSYESCVVELPTVQSQRVILRAGNYKWERVNLEDTDMLETDIYNICHDCFATQNAKVNPKKLQKLIAKNVLNPNFIILKQTPSDEPRYTFSAACWEAILTHAIEKPEDAGELRVPIFAFGIPNSSTLDLCQQQGVRIVSRLHLLTASNLIIPHKSPLPLSELIEHDMLFHSTNASRAPAELQQFGEKTLPVLYHNFMQAVFNGSLDDAHSTYQVDLKEEIFLVHQGQFEYNKPFGNYYELFVGPFGDYPLSVDQLQAYDYHHGEPTKKRTRDQETDRNTKWIWAMANTVAQNKYFTKSFFILNAFLDYLKKQLPKLQGSSKDLLKIYIHELTQFAVYKVEGDRCYPVIANDCEEYRTTGTLTLATSSDEEIPEKPKDKDTAHQQEQAERLKKENKRKLEMNLKKYFLKKEKYIIFDGARRVSSRVMAKRASTPNQ